MKTYRTRILLHIKKHTWSYAWYIFSFFLPQVGGGTKTRRPIALRMQYNPECDQPRCFLSLENGKEEARSLQEIQVRCLSRVACLLSSMGGFSRCVFVYLGGFSSVCFPSGGVPFSRVFLDGRSIRNGGKGRARLRKNIIILAE